jgi:PAS domain S-box-containing protein
MLIPDDRQHEEPRILSRLRRGERIEHFETVRRKKDGTLIDISLTISPVKDALGNVIGASKIGRDVSDRKRAERAIEELNEQLKTDLLAMTRMQQLSTRLLQADDIPDLLGEILAAGMEITGAEMGDIQLKIDGRLRIVSHRGFGPRFLTFFDSIDIGTAACGRALAGGVRVIVEDVAESELLSEPAMLSTLLDAGVRAVQSTPLISRSGHALGTFSTHFRRPGRPGDRALRMLDVLARQAADLIERTRAQAELAASEARFRQLADSMPQIVWTARPDGQVDYYNERWFEYTGCPRGEFGESSWAYLLHPDDLKPAADAWDEAVRTGAPFEKELRLWDRQANRWRWFIGRALPVRNEAGRIVKWFGSSTDIDEQKHVEEELRRANQDLEQFAFSASHDLQEPLRSVKIYSDLLLRRCQHKLDGEAQEFLAFLREGATRMETLVHDLLAYTRVSKFDEEPGVSDAGGTLEVVLANLAGNIAESGARILAENLPEVRMHSAHLQQLFQNLVGNAIKYRSPDRAPVIRVSAERVKGDWIISVSDNGIGIEPQYKEGIFGLFKRLHTNDHYSGTGIGLAICQRIVDRYHGRIWVESEPGIGSTFRFSIPD